MSINLIIRRDKKRRTRKTDAAPLNRCRNRSLFLLNDRCINRRFDVEPPEILDRRADFVAVADIFHLLLRHVAVHPADGRFRAVVEQPGAMSRSAGNRDRTEEERLSAIDPDFRSWFDRIEASARGQEEDICRSFAAFLAGQFCFTEVKRLTQFAKLRKDRNMDIKALAKMIRDVLADNYICVVGGQQAIEENKKEFNKILKQ